MIIKAHVDIHAPLAVVWGAFSDMENWKQWNRTCRDCRYELGNGMVPGTCFSFEITPLFIPLRIHPRIVHCLPGEEVVWEGARFGVHARHAFTFSEAPGQVRVTSIEAFSGLLLPAIRLMRLPQRLHRLTEFFLSSLKQYAEGCCALRPPSPADK